MLPKHEGKRVVALYTDGACSGNQNEENIGGWGAVLEYGEAVKELYGGEINTTNNRMELKALLEGLRALKKEALDIDVFADSAYLANCFREKWYVSWESNGWKTANKKPVENRDLWEEILALVKKNNVTFYRVKGHINVNSKSFRKEEEVERFLEWNGAGFTEEDFFYVTEKNNRVDALANQAMDEIRETK